MIVKRNGYLFVVVCMHAAILYGMERRVMLVAQQKYDYGVAHFLNLLDAGGIYNDHEPYDCFKSLLASSGTPMRKLRALSSYNLGLMCKAQVGVPQSENGIYGAQRYFLQAVDEGHVPALGELARCARETGNYTKALEWWRQQRFLEMCHDCLPRRDKAIPGDVRTYDEHLVEQVAQAITYSGCWPAHSRQQPLYCEAIDTLIAALKEPALRDNNRARCLIAHLYASMPHVGHLPDDVIQWLTPVLHSCPSDELITLIDSTQSRDAFKIMADTGNAVACAYLGIALFHEQQYEEAYYYCHKAWQQGDVRAGCYCICMKIMGQGISKSLADAVHEIKELARTEHGRQELKTLAHLCGDVVSDVLLHAKAKQKESANFILGVILYESHEDDVRAYNYLSAVASEHSIYACYCCAQMLLQGRGVERSLDDAASMYARILAADSIDDRMRDKCVYALREIAHSGSIAGSCEYCIASLHGSVAIEEFKKNIELVFAHPKIEHTKYVRYLQSSSCMQALMQSKEEGNPRAFLMLSVLQAFQADSSKKIDTKLQLLHSAFEYMSIAHQQKIATDQELSNVAMRLVDALKEKGNFKKAKNFLESAVKFGFMDVKCALASLIIEDKNCSREDLEKALGYFEESALQGNVDHQRLLAQIYRRDSQWCDSCITIQADIGKSYKFVSMLLESLPEDVEGRYVLGHLLGSHAGEAGIPASQAVRAYELLSSVIDKIKVMPIDYYLLGRISFANENYEQAMAWFDRAGDFPNCTCYRGLIMLIEAEKGNKLFDKNMAFECLEKSLSAARKYIVVNQIGYCELFRHELLIRILTEEADKGDLRARTLLARIVYLFEDETLGISKHKAFSYLVEAATAGVAFARSFLGFMYLRGVGVAQSGDVALEYFINVTQDKEVPGFVRDESAEELFAMGRELVVSPINVTAAYYAVPALLQNPTPENVQRAIMSIDKAEADFVHNFAKNKQIAAIIYLSGAWAALRHLVEQGNANIAAVLGLLVIFRFANGCADFEVLRAEGLPLLELALKNGATVVNAVGVSRRYFQCVNHALRAGVRDFVAFRALLERAQQLDSKNQDIAYLLATMYLKQESSDCDQAKIVEKGKSMLEMLADNGHQLAALDMGIMYLTNGSLGTFVAHFIKGIHYLKIAAKSGNNYALSLLVSRFLVEKIHNVKRLKAELLESIEFLQSQQSKTPEEKLFFSCMRALMLNQVDKAVVNVEQLSKNAAGAPLCILACMIILPLKDGCQKVGGLFLKAIEVVGRNHIDIAQNGIIGSIKTILFKLDAKSSTDHQIASYVSTVRSILGHYNYTF